jgi:hypothetical protein
VLGFSVLTHIQNFVVQFPPILTSGQRLRYSELVSTSNCLSQTLDSIHGLGSTRIRPLAAIAVIDTGLDGQDFDL